MLKLKLCIYKIKAQNIEESEKLLLKHIVKYGEEIPNFSIVNFSVEGSIEKS